MVIVRMANWTWKESETARECSFYSEENEREFLCLFFCEEHTSEFYEVLHSASESGGVYSSYS